MPPGQPPSPPPFVFVDVRGGDPREEVALMHNTVYDVILTGGTIQPGDWVVWVRSDRQSDCSSALSSDLAAADPGGIAFIGADGRLRVSVHLIGGIDGHTDPNPYDTIQSLSSNRTEEPSSTYTMCHASAASSGVTYSQNSGPTSTAEFNYYPYVKLFTQHHPPTPPPPTRAPASPPCPPSAPPAPLSPADKLPPYVASADIVPNTTIVLVYLSEPVLPVVPPISGDCFTVSLSNGSATLENWTLVEWAWEDTNQAESSKGRQLSEGISRVALLLGVSGGLNAASLS